MGILQSLLSSIFADYARDRMNRGLATHANRRKPGDPHPTSVHTGWISRAGEMVACAITVPLAAITVWSIVAGKPIDGAWAAAPIFGATAVCFCIVLYDGFVRRIEWSETEVLFRKWNGARTVPWSEIIGIEEKSYPPHLRIAFRDGAGFAIDETMHGSRYFMEILDRRLHPEGPGPTGRKRTKRRQRGKNA